MYICTIHCSAKYYVPTKIGYSSLKNQKDFAALSVWLACGYCYGA